MEIARDDRGAARPGTNRGRPVAASSGLRCGAGSAGTRPREAWSAGLAGARRQRLRVLHEPRPACRRPPRRRPYRSARPVSRSLRGAPAGWPRVVRRTAPASRGTVRGGGRPAWSHHPIPRRVGGRLRAFVGRAASVFSPSTVVTEGCRLLVAYRREVARTYQSSLAPRRAGLPAAECRQAFAAAPVGPAASPSPRGERSRPSRHPHAAWQRKPRPGRNARRWDRACVPWLRSVLRRHASFPTLTVRGRQTARWDCRGRWWLPT